MASKNRIRSIVLILLILSLLTTLAYGITGTNIREEVREFRIDTTSPAITYVDPTPANKVVLNQNYIEINVSVTEQNIQNITYTLQNLTGTVNETTVTTNTTYIKWVNLKTAYNANYWYEVAIWDKIGYYNITVMRKVTLNTPPSYSTIPHYTGLGPNTINKDYFDLDDYFSDSDGDIINYTFSGNVSIGILINYSTNKVTITTPNESVTETVIFTANDTLNTTDSTGIIISSVTVCGDGYCTSDENCNSCETDCGKCAGEPAEKVSEAPVIPPALPPPALPPPALPPVPPPVPPPPPPPVPPAEEAPAEVAPAETVAEAVTKAVTEAVEAVAEAAEAVVEAAAKAAKAIAGLFKAIPESTIDPEEIEIISTPCAPEELEIKKVVEEFKPPKGYKELLDAFKVDANNNYNLTLTVPLNFIDIHGLRCKDNVCERVELGDVEELVCKREDIKEFIREDLLLSVDKLPIQITKKTITLSEKERIIESGKYKVEFVDHISEGEVTITQPSNNIPQPENTKLKIIGTPLILKVSELGTTLKVTLPYYNDSLIDPNSVAIYVRYNETWFFIGGKVEKDIVTAVVEYAETYLVNGEIQFVLIGTLCDTCLGSYFTKVHQGVSRDAVIFVHGLGSSPATFDSIIKDVKLTNQPWQVYTFGYPTFRKIEENAIEFANWIESESSNFDYLYLASHSMGGLVSQAAVYYAYQENQKTPGRYKFVDKVRKVMLIATPNKGSPGAPVLKNLLKIFAGSEENIPLFNPESSGVAELIEGKTIPQVPGVRYYVIAGTKPYEINLGITKISSAELFEEGQLNDGIISVESAQSVGDQVIDNKCKNYWEIPTTHTELLFNPVTRGIVENVIASEILKDIKGVRDKAVLGNLKYVSLDVEEGEFTYRVLGKRIDPNKNPDITQCSCGNGFCNIGETVESCPSDCANVISLENQLMFLPLIVLLLLILSFISGGLSIFKSLKYRRLSKYYKYMIAFFVAAAIPYVKLMLIKNVEKGIMVSLAFFTDLMLIILVTIFFLIMGIFRRKKKKEKKIKEKKKIRLLKLLFELLHKLKSEIKKFIRNIPYILGIYKRLPKLRERVRKEHLKWLERARKARARGLKIYLFKEKIKKILHKFVLELSAFKRNTLHFLRIYKTPAELKEIEKKKHLEAVKKYREKIKKGRLRRLRALDKARRIRIRRLKILKIKRAILHAIGLYKTPEELIEIEKKKHLEAVKKYREKLRKEKEIAERKRLRALKKYRRKQKIKQKVHESKLAIKAIKRAILHAIGLYKTPAELREIERIKHLRAVRRYREKERKERLKRLKILARARRIRIRRLKIRKLKIKVIRKLKRFIRLLGYRTKRERELIRRRREFEKLEKERLKILVKERKVRRKELEKIRKEQLKKLEEIKKEREEKLEEKRKELEKLEKERLKRLEEEKKKREEELEKIRKERKRREKEEEEILREIQKEKEEKLEKIRKRELEKRKELEEERLRKIEEWKERKEKEQEEILRKIKEEKEEKLEKKKKRLEKVRKERERRLRKLKIRKIKFNIKKSGKDTLHSLGLYKTDEEKAIIRRKKELEKLKKDRLKRLEEEKKKREEELEKIRKERKRRDKEREERLKKIREERKKIQKEKLEKIREERAKEKKEQEDFLKRIRKRKKERRKVLLKKKRKKKRFKKLKNKLTKILKQKEEDKIKIQKNTLKDRKEFLERLRKEKNKFKKL